MKCNVGTQLLARDPLTVEAIRDPHGEPKLGDEWEARVMLAIIEEEVGLIFDSVLNDCANVDLITDQLCMVMMSWLRDHLRLVAKVAWREINGLSEFLGCHVPDGEAFHEFSSTYYTCISILAENAITFIMYLTELNIYALVNYFHIYRALLYVHGKFCHVSHLILSWKFF